MIKVSSSLSSIHERDVNYQEILITKMPEISLVVDDLKSGYQAIKKVKCCINSNSGQIIKHIEHTHVSIVEISNSSECTDREFLINHLVLKMGKKCTMLPVFCQSCEKIRCRKCCTTRKCKSCKQQSCRKCAGRCGSCREWICEQCSYLCHAGCDEPCCEDCYHHVDDDTGVCESCKRVMLSDYSDDSDGENGESDFSW